MRIYHFEVASYYWLTSSYESYQWKKQHHLIELLQQMQMTLSENEANLIFFDWRREGFCAELGSKWGDQRNQWCNMVQQNVFVQVDWKNIGRCQRYIPDFLANKLLKVCFWKLQTICWCFLDAWRAILMEFHHKKSFFWHCREYVYKKPEGTMGASIFASVHPKRKNSPINFSANRFFQHFHLHHTPHRVAKVPVGRPSEADTCPCHAACGHARTRDFWQSGSKKEWEDSKTNARSFSFEGRVTTMISLFASSLFVVNLMFDSIGDIQQFLPLLQRELHSSFDQTIIHFAQKHTHTNVYTVYIYIYSVQLLDIYVHITTY